MKVFNQIKKYAYQFLLLAALTIAESYYILSSVFSIENSFLIASIAVLLYVILILLILSLPKKISVPLFIVLGAGLIVLLYSYIDSISDLIVQTIDAISQKSFLVIDEPIITIFVLSLGILLINLVFMVLFKLNVLTAVLSIVLVCVLYFRYDYINPYFSTFYLVTTLLIFIRWVAPQIYEDESLAGKYLISFRFITIIALIIAPLSVLMSNLNPEPLKWIDDLDWFESDEEVPYVSPIIRIDGQSKLTILSQEFTYRDTKMMIVTSPYADRLRNKTYDMYIQNSWTKAVDETDANIGMQYSYNDMNVLLEETGIPYTLFDMEIELVAQSQMVFAPLHSRVISTLNEHLKENYYDDLYVDDPLVENTIYTLNVIKVDYKSKEFIDLIKNSKSEIIDNIDNYLSIPQTLKQKLEPIAANLTKNAENNYERSKIIESYLSKEYEYSLEPPEKPANVDFVEYFLFETKKGFCTHYATSMIMLLRSIGIPCRYVTGYLLAPPEKDIFIPGVDPEEFVFVEGVPYEFNVQKQNSHAWVEVWFDDFGWLPFEPTSRYTSLLSFGYELNDYDFTDITSEAIVKPTESSDKLYILFIVVFAFVVIMIIGVRIYIVSKRTIREKIVYVWKNIKKIYYSTRKINKHNETAREFFFRTDEKNPDLCHALEIYEYAVFSGKEIASEYLAEIKVLYKKIRTNKNNYSDKEDE